MSRGVLVESRPTTQWTEHEIITAAIGSGSNDVSTHA